jgi:hypothetical protein
MRNKIGLATLLLFISVVAVAIGYASRIRQNGGQADKHIKELEEAEKKARLSIPGAVELAKARGQQRIVVPGLQTLYMGLAETSDELDEKLNDYTVVIGKLVDKQSYVRSEGAIETWNKFRVIDTLSPGPAKTPYFPWPPVPDQLLPLKENEILVHTQGGVVTVDGVEVTQWDSDIPHFEKSPRYLLVLSYDPSARKGFLELGSQSLLPMNADNSLNGRSDKYLLQQLMKERYGGAVSGLKQKLAQRPHK